MSRETKTGVKYMLSYWKKNVLTPTLQKAAVFSKQFVVEFQIFMIEDERRISMLLCERNKIFDSSFYVDSKGRILA